MTNQPEPNVPKKVARSYLLDYINLEDIRSLLGEVFDGYERGYVITSRISAVKLFEDNEEYHKKFKHIVSTMAIDDFGTLYVAEEYVNKHLKSIDDLKAILMHELFHQVLGDLKSMKSFKKNDPDLGLKQLAVNIAADCRINAFLYYFLDENKLDNTVFDRMYATIKDEFEVSDFLLELLHKNSTFSSDERKKKECIPLIKIHTDLYSPGVNRQISFQETYNHVLNYLMSEQEKYGKLLSKLTDQLIGNHKFDPSNPGIDKQLGQDPDEDTDGNDLPEDGDGDEEDAGDLLSDIVNGKGDKPPGVSNTAYTSILNEAQGIDEKIDLEIFKRLSFDNLFANTRMTNITKIKNLVKMPRIPTKLAKRDYFLLMNGVDPLLWYNPAYTELKVKRMLPIYLDVSGSMYSCLPEIIKLITNISETDLEYVWGFSNKIYKHTMEDLKNQRIKSTGGTDFDCILDHAIQQQYRNIVVITDGEAYCNRGNQKLDEIDEVITILCSEHRARDNWLSRIYDNTMDIESVVE
jgi:predicted metal-dependent peptidase